MNKLNESFLGFDGVIGRYGFFLNMVIISAICALYTMPYQIWTMSHVETMADLFNPTKCFFMAPVFLKILVLLGTIFISVATVSNIKRRLYDICGEDNSFLVFAYAAFAILTTFSFILPYWCFIVFGFINFCLFMVLLFKKGQITGNLPYDYRKEFNWGAFLGTWIWGIVNKSYKTLWIFLLGLTPISLHYSLYCGLRGNEWAYTNKKWTDVDAFNEAQKKQTTIFAILFCIIIPIIYFAIVFAIVAIIAFSVTAGSANNPQSLEDNMTKIEKTLDSFGSIYFEKREITENENKFYVAPKDWEKYSFGTKKDILDMAANLSANQRDKEFRKNHPNEHKYFSKTSELPRTKIYNVDNNQLLGEFVFNEKLLSKEKPSAMELVKAGMNAYRFYNP